MIKLYSTHCPQCKALTMKLDKANIEYEICDDVEQMKLLGIASAPILEVDGKLYNFKQAVDWINGK